MTISASGNNFLSWKSYKNCIQCHHVWWMCMRIMAINGHQRVLNQLNQCFFAYFISGTALTCPLEDSHWWNILCARITQLSTDFWYLLYIEVKPWRSERMCASSIASGSIHIPHPSQGKNRAMMIEKKGIHDRRRDARRTFCHACPRTALPLLQLQSPSDSSQT